jgi:lon-related putative ATP-dependent protease
MDSDSFSKQHRLDAASLRWQCDPAQFDFETTREIEQRRINIIGQPRAQEALELGLANRAEGYNIFVSGEVGTGRSTVVSRALDGLDEGRGAPEVLVFVHNFKDPDQPCLLRFPAGRGKAFRRQMDDLVDSLRRDLPRLFESDVYRKRRSEMIEAASAEQKTRFKELEKRVQERGFVLTQVQAGPYVRSQLVPLVAGNPVDMDQLEDLVQEGKFSKEDYDRLQSANTELRTELEGLSREMRAQDRTLRDQLEELDRELAGPLVEEAITDIREEFETDQVAVYLTTLGEDVLEHLDQFHEAAESKPSPDAESSEFPRRYAVNVLVEHSPSDGPPVIWEHTPSYRNLFGTVSRSRAENGEWESDHTRIKPGSLVRANGGFLVLDAIDVLVEPGVWAALKRSLRHRQVEIQTFDPAFLGGSAIKPEPIPVDVKVLLIGTQQIYRLLYAHDEDFKKIFKVKAEFAMQTPLSSDEICNYARLIQKRCDADVLPAFHREAVARVVEHGVRLAGHQSKLTTQFTRISDLIREAGYWAKREGSPHVEAAHVELAVRRRAYRVDLIEELLREQISEGTILLKLEGSCVGQVNGLAVLDLGDHVFGQPTRITATTAMGRAGIIDIDREAAMSGSIHTKGVLILTGFLRERFAQNKPLALTASIVFEQNYGGIDGDSASCAELYALLSSLSGVPIRQGIAVTGSVNQRGEVQPVGGTNEKIEGYYDVCRQVGLNGEQGVMIPKRNLPQLMLRSDVVEAVRTGNFHVWAVSAIEEGLEVLTGVGAGAPGDDGRYPEDSVLGRVDARLCQLADEVGRFGLADVDPARRDS